MRVTSIALLSNDIELGSFELNSGSAKSKYVIRNIAGLDAEEIIPRFYGFSKDGSKRFYDFKLNQRDIVIRIMPNPRYNIGETISTIRDELYRTISGSRTGKVDLQFYSLGSLLSQISGHIIKFEASYFTNLPEVQITIRCNDPMFRSMNPVRLVAADISSSNPLIIGDNTSTAPHGFSFKVTLTGALTDFTIQDQASDPDWDFKITPDGGFLSGDELYFSSEFTNRHLYIVRSAVTTHLLDVIDPTSIWPIIFPGLNEFYFLDHASFDWDYLEFNTAYWGV